MARQKKESAEQKKMLKQEIAGKRKMSKKRKAGNADEDAMALASSFSQEELEMKLADELEAWMEWSRTVITRRMPLLTQAKRTRRMTTSYLHSKAPSSIPDADHLPLL